MVGSAATGIPPFAATSLVAGQLGCSLPRFVVAGGTGRFVRFAAVALGTTGALSLL